MALLLKIFLTVAVATIGSATVTLKVGIYNYIPDLNNDTLFSYQEMIEDGFNNENHQVIAVVNNSQYDPYGNLTKHIVEDGFDILEIDTLSLKELVDEDLVVEIPITVEGVLTAAESASMIDGTYYAYPTLVCGNFLISFQPGSEIGCEIDDAKHDYENFHTKLVRCFWQYFWKAMHYQRMIGGKMNDDDGYYVPIFYIDGYIDIYGRDAAEDAIKNVLQEDFDENLCERLTLFIMSCYNRIPIQNKCYYNYDGSYVNGSDYLYQDFADDLTMFYYGFSEGLGKIKQITDRKPEVALSGPFGDENNLLMFTDGLVVSKTSWDAASEEKKTAIKKFLSYFVSKELRKKITLGQDLNTPQKRYLLQANKAVYTSEELTDDKIYQDILPSLQNAVPMPYINYTERKRMQQVLTEQCIQLPPELHPATKRAMEKRQAEYTTRKPSAAGNHKIPKILRKKKQEL